LLGLGADGHINASAANKLLGLGADGHINASAANKLLGLGADGHINASAANKLLGLGADGSINASAAKELLVLGAGCGTDSAREIAKFVATMSAIVTMTARAFFVFTLFCIFFLRLCKWVNLN
jgi:hypothetical protein